MLFSGFLWPLKFLIEILVKTPLKVSSKFSWKFYKYVIILITYLINHLGVSVNERKRTISFLQLTFLLSSTEPASTP